MANPDPFRLLDRMKLFPLMLLSLCFLHLAGCEDDSPAPPDLGEWVFVPAGSFRMGETGTARAEPEHEVTLTRHYYLSRYETTNLQFASMLQWAWENGRVLADSSEVRYPYGQHLIQLMDLSNPACEIAFDSTGFRVRASRDPRALAAYPQGYEAELHPVKLLSWRAAALYCDWRSIRNGLAPYYNDEWEQGAGHDPYLAEGFRLPTEAEWEHAARYPDSRVFPWGNQPLTPQRAAFRQSWSSPVGSRPSGESALGLADMAGNVWEWTDDGYGEYPSAAERQNPLGRSGGWPHTIRGGYWDNGESLLRTTARTSFGVDYPHAGIGFRVCRLLP